MNIIAAEKKAHIAGDGSAGRLKCDETLGVSVKKQYFCYYKSVSL